MHSPYDFDLISRFLAGEATPAEAEALRAGAALDPALAALLSEARKPVSNESWDVDAGWARLRRKTRRTPRLLNWSTAAAAVLIVGLGVVVMQRALQRGDESISVAAQQYMTAAGERRVIVLPDSSTVTLAPRSQLVVPVVFNGAERMVRLTGEAFFDVKPDSARPFVVAARGTLTRVLGTSFNVSAYSEQSAVEVLVVTGRVLVKPERAADGTILRPGQLARTDSTAVLGVDAVADLAAYTSWREGRLVFRDVTLADALPRLERWFGIDLRVPDGRLARTRFTAYLDQQQLDDVLNVLAVTLNARYERADTTVTFHPQQ